MLEDDGSEPHTEDERLQPSIAVAVYMRIHMLPVHRYVPSSLSPAGGGCVVGCRHLFATEGRPVTRTGS